VAGQIFRPFSLGDVVIGLQDSGGPSALVLPQGPPARDSDLRSVSLRMDELPLPAAGAEQLRRDLFKWQRKNRPQELARNLAERLLLVPTVQLLRARFQNEITSFMLRTKIVSCVRSRSCARSRAPPPPACAR